MSCGTFSEPDGSLTWRVWAPQVPSLELVLYRAPKQPTAIPMQAEEQGYFVHTERDAPEGLRYAFRFPDGRDLPDPASRWQPDGVNQPSAVVRPERFEWSEGDWRGIGREELVIYELHVGTFTPEGTFDAVIPRLAELKELGITAIEIMPVAEFPGNRDWGYDGVHLFAVQSTYGGPQGLVRLINACHQQGIAVLLDVVYNHFGPEGNYVGEFGPYFTDRYHTPWGSAVNFDGPGSDPVRAFVLDNVRQWIRDYHVDGLRLDAVHAIFDFSAKHILAEIKEVADEEAERLGRPAYVIAESDLNDVRLIDPPEAGGYGLDAQWSDDFHHCVHSLLTSERSGYYEDFGRPEQLVKALSSAFVYDGQFSPHRERRHGGPTKEHAGDRFVVCIQNHDQVGNRAAGDRFGTLLTPAQQRLAAGLLLLSPHIPLLFMGEEYGETRPFPFFCSFLDRDLIQAVREGRRREFAAFKWQGEVPDPQAEETFQSAKLSWDWPADSWHAGLRRLYSELLAARRRWPVLKDFTNRTVRLFGDESAPVLELRRGPEGSDEVLVAFFNLSDQEQPLPQDLCETSMLLVRSEAPKYAGARMPNDPRSLLLPWEFQAFGPRSWIEP